MQEDIKNRLISIFAEWAVPKWIVAINFWVFEMIDGYWLYMIWSRSYDRTNNDRACNQDYSPKSKYLEIKNTDDNWSEFLLKVKFILKKLIEEDFKDFFLQVEYITIWFDDWELEELVVK